MTDTDYKELDEDAPEFEREGLKPEEQRQCVRCGLRARPIQGLR